MGRGRPPGTWWAVEARSGRLDGDRRYLVWGSPPRLFYTRRECREYIEATHGYIRHRPDLRAEPFGLRMPQAVLVAVEVVPQEPEWWAAHERAW